MCRLLSSNGIPALALALFATRDTQPDPDRVPVEYVERAIRFLKARGYRRLAIDGMSKGSEPTLPTASMFPGLSCVIVRVPSNFVSEGLKGRGKSKRPSGTSCRSLHGQQLPYASYRMRSFGILPTLLKRRELYLPDINSDKTVTEESLIPIERIKAPILILSSKRDTVWPSYQSGLWIEDRLRQKGFGYPVRHIAYDYLSHAMVTELPPLYRLAFSSERAYARQCRREREDLRRQLSEWISMM